MDVDLEAAQSEVGADEAPKDDEHDGEQLLLKIPVVLFGVPLGVASQANLYRAIGRWKDDGGLGAAVESANWGFWCLGNGLLVVVGSLYLAKCWKHWWAVQQEWADGVRSNFMYAPIIAVLLSLLGTPSEMYSKPAMEAAWWVCIVGYCALSLPLYQSWLRKERRTLHHGNPTYQIAVVSNFLIATVGFDLGHDDVPFAFLAVGCVFQITVFISMFTAMKRAPHPVLDPEPQLSDEGTGCMCFKSKCLSSPSSVRVVPHDQLNPVMFLFIAPPSVAALAAAAMQGSFDNHFSRGAFSLALFLYAMQVASPQVFLSLTFTPSWWAFTFPTTAAATASVAFARVRPESDVPDVLAAVLTSLSTLCVLSVFVRTVVALGRGEFLKCDPLLKAPKAALAAPSHYILSQPPDANPMATPLLRA